MDATKAVEEVIDRHDSPQERALGEAEHELREGFQEFRSAELAPRDLTRGNGAETGP